MSPIKINIALLFLFGILFFNTKDAFSQQKDSAASVLQVISYDSLKKDSTQKEITWQDSSLKSGPDSTKKKSTLQSILPSNPENPLPDSTTKNNVLNKIAPVNPLKTSTIPDSTKNKNGIQTYLSKTTSGIIPDSTSRKRILKKIIPKTYGTVSAGYDYGVIPFASNASYPLGYFKTQGNIGVTTLGIPLLATYYYSTLKSVSGL